MKNNDKNSTLVVETKHEGMPYRYMTQEESLPMVDLAKKSFYKPKYRYALKVSTQLDVRQYYETYPKASAKDVLIETMKGYSSAIPSSILLEMAQIILSEWETIQATKKEMVIA